MFPWLYISALPNEKLKQSALSLVENKHAVYDTNGLLFFWYLFWVSKYKETFLKIKPVMKKVLVN